ncbi:hypothetical protein CEP54_005336 [Fusarium duplospermum]|uniref:Uncharacterized protein n=1 Tax=Fusarium duplospermum TaxID=1325734 RepID=A0A428QD45_9HYPO|nr:hypothetical protein CEP54_005336 [Fusarium duplospermum]
MRLSRTYLFGGVCLILLASFLLLNRRPWRSERDVLLDYASSSFDVLESSSTKLNLEPRTVPVTVVVAAISSDDPTKLHRESGLRKGDSQIIYFADQPSQQNGLPQNKGNEAMVYLTYLIDHYEDLPEVMVFMHGHRISWHNNALLRRGSALAVNNLRPEVVLERGFISLACDKVLRRVIKPLPGAHGPSILDLSREDWEAEDGGSRLRSQSPKELERQYTDLWHQLFPSPKYDAPPSGWQYFTGAQFALSRELFHSIPQDRLRFLRDWILWTNLSSRSAGAVFETLWEAVFRDGHFSNTTSFSTPVVCYCELYGMCSRDDRLPAESVEVSLEAATLMIGHLLDH